MFLKIKKNGYNNSYSRKQSVEQFYKDDAGEWHFGNEITEGSMTLRSFPIDLSVEDIYFDVAFETVV